MICIETLCYAPVKGLRMVMIPQAILEKPGIPGDRAFFVIDEAGRLITQRECAQLVQVVPVYELPEDRLSLHFPDGSLASGTSISGQEISVRFFGTHDVEGHLVEGPWSEALSNLAERPLRLVKAARPGTSFDGFPLSICSTASLAAFAQAASCDADNGMRFRQNIHISGVGAHEEDEWVGAEVRVGEALLRVKMRDPRCVVTTLDPQTGEPDLDSLRVIASYRTDQPKEANFGVYCTVVEPGNVRIGDELTPPVSTSKR